MSENLRFRTSTLKLNLMVTLDAKAAYSDADFVVIAAPTN